MRWLRILLWILAGLAGAVVLVFVGFVVLFAIALSDATKVTTKLSAYPGVLEGWSPELVDHFPRKVPANATDVSLAELPGMMQGSGFVQLRMKLPATDVAAILAGAKAKAVRSCPSQCTNSVEDPEFWSVPYLAAGVDPEQRFPADFTVYALSTDGDWNHPTGKGVAVSVQRSEVVYWAED